MSTLFSTYSIKDNNIKNRLVRSATTSYWSNKKGILRDQILSHYHQLARGGVGLIIKGHSYVSKQGKAHIGQSGLCEQHHLPKMTQLIRLVHKEKVPIIAQLNHAGYKSINEKITASEYHSSKITAKKASIDDIHKIKNSFINSAILAQQVGFDGLQIHAAHGYLISQFLSNNINLREDPYGGSLKNRARLLLEILAEIKNNVKTSMIVGVKLNCDDFAKEKGIRIEDSIKIAKWLKKEGVDFIEISGGGPKSVKELRLKRGKPQKTAPYYEANFAGHAEKIRKEILDVPLMLVDGIRSRKTMDSLLEFDIVDFISMSKPFIIEPDIPKRLQNGQERSACIDCNECVAPKNFGKKMLQCHYKD